MVLLQQRLPRAASAYRSVGLNDARLKGRSLGKAPFHPSDPRHRGLGREERRCGRASPQQPFRLRDLTPTPTCGPHLATRCSTHASGSRTLCVLGPGGQNAGRYSACPPPFPVSSWQRPGILLSLHPVIRTERRTGQVTGSTGYGNQGKADKFSR